MTTISLLGFGSKLQYGDGASPEVFTSVAQLRKLSKSGAKAEFDDVTNMDSTSAYHEIVATLLDPGGVDFEGIMNPADTTQQALQAAFNGRTLKNWRIQFPSAGGRLSFAAYVETGLEPSIEYNKSITFSGKLKVSGPVTITPSV